MGPNHNYCEQCGRTDNHIDSELYGILQKLSNLIHNEEMHRLRREIERLRDVIDSHDPYYGDSDEDSDRW